MLPVSVPAPGGAEVLATDGPGRPALVRRRVGAGALVLATYPVEHFAARLPNANPEPTWRLYRALAAEAGVSWEVRVDRPEVLVDRLVHRDGASYVWMVNGSDRSLSAAVTSRDGCRLEDVETGERPAADVELPPYGVRILRLGSDE